MGYIRHHAIIVTSKDKELLLKAESKAYDHFDVCSGIISSGINGYCSFFIPPDGSNEGWDESKDGDRVRHIFISWLKEQANSDGSSALSWVEIQYGDDNLVTMIINSSDDEIKKVEEVMGL